MSLNVIRETVRRMVDLISTKQYSLALQACSNLRPTEADLERIIDEYGGNFIISPEDADIYIDAIAVRGRAVPTWSVTAPLWTQEEGQSDLTLELTITVYSTHLDVEFDGLHVL